MVTKSTLELFKMAKKFSLEGNDLTGREMQALLTLEENPLTVSELAKELKCSERLVRDIIKSLEEKGFINRSSYRDQRGLRYMTAIQLADVQADEFGSLKIKNWAGNEESLATWIQKLVGISPDAATRAAFYQALQYLFYKSYSKAQGLERADGPTSSEVKTFLMNIVKQHKRYLEGYLNLLESNVFDDSKAVHKLIGKLDPDSEEFTKAVTQFIMNWDKKMFTIAGYHQERNT